jgi:hypothetical protein
MRVRSPKSAVWETPVLSFGRFVHALARARRSAGFSKRISCPVVSMCELRFPPKASTRIGNWIVQGEERHCNCPTVGRRARFHGHVGFEFEEIGGGSASKSKRVVWVDLLSVSTEVGFSATFRPKG